MSQSNANENTQTSTADNSVLSSPQLTFNIVKINNYFKLYCNNDTTHLKKLHDLVYSGSQFDVEYSDVCNVAYNIINERILNEYNFIKREFVDETMEDVAKYIKMLSESIAFFRDDDTSKSNIENKQVSEYLKYSDTMRIGINTKHAYKDLKHGENKATSRELNDKEDEDIKPAKGISIRGIDNDITNLCAYSTDMGAQYNQDITIHENLNGELTASHKVLYNRHFYNAVLVDKFTYDLLFSCKQVRDYMPEIEVISELFLKDEGEIKEFSQLIMHEIFYSSDDVRKIVNFYLSKNNTECPSITAIRKYINANFTLDSDITNRIQFKVLFDDICTGMNINSKYHEAIKRSLPLLLTELGLAKKRYSEGIFWYGLKKMSGLLGPIDLNKDLDQLTSEIVKLRDAQDEETSKVLDYVFDSQIPKTKVKHDENYPLDLAKPKCNRNPNRQIRCEPPNPKVTVSPWNQSTIEPNPYLAPV